MLVATVVLPVPPLPDAIAIFMASLLFVLFVEKAAVAVTVLFDFSFPRYARADNVNCRINGMGLFTWTEIFSSREEVFSHKADNFLNTLLIWIEDITALFCYF